MAYELYQSRHKGYEIDNLLDDVVDLNADVAALKTEYDANKVKMSDGTSLPTHLVGTYATKTDLSAKADSTQVASDIAAATADMATNTSVASAIATATTDMATNTSVSSAIATATSDMATNTSVASAISTATADMATNTSVASDIATATTDMATNASVASAIAAAAYTLPEATTSTLGGVKADGTTITVDADGTIHGASTITSLNDIGDVNASNPSDGQALCYDSTEDEWVPMTVGGGGGTGGHTIKDADGNSMTSRSNLQFAGDSSVSDDGTNNKTVVTPHELSNAEIAEIISELPLNPASTYVPNTGFTPVGTVISVMGTSAPANYLECNGDVYNIVQYPVLAKYFKDQFGAENYFGGNGTTTFAVPDLRGEFLRGTGTNSHSDGGNGASVGVHQAPTGVNPGWTNNTTGGWSLPVVPSSSYSSIIIDNGDKYVDTGTRKSIIASTELKEKTDTAANSGYWTIRPTNTAVLFCIATQNIYVDAKNDYSTTEKVVGTWISGKPLYQITIEGTMPNVTTDGTYVSNNVAHNIPNIDLPFIVESFVLDYSDWPTTSTLVRRLPYTLNSGNQLKVSIGRSIIQYASAIKAYNGSKVYTTIQYTKTTD